MDKPTSPKKATLADILDDEDDLGLLDVEPLPLPSVSSNALTSRLNEIIEFYETQGRLPLMGTDSLNEQLLAEQLDVFRSDERYRQALQQFDIPGLLDGGPCPQGDTPIPTSSEPPPVVVEDPPTIEEDNADTVMSLDDILDMDDDLLSFDNEDIFALNHVVHKRQPKQDEMASRQPCADFPRFEPLFKQLRDGLASQTFSVIRFRHELRIQEGDFFILNGLIGYVNNVGESLKDKNPRCHLVYENGAEIHMLYLSLTHGLVRDKSGRKLNLNGWSLRPDMSPIPSGFVYVLATQSDNPVLQQYKPDLYKIGFTEGTVEDRVKYAEKDRTFLEAPVTIVAQIQCFDNIDAHKVEMLIHGFLGKQKLNITMHDANGRVYRPSEWFHVSLDTITAVIEHILDGTIAQYRMNNTTGKIIPKQKM